MAEKKWMQEAFANNRGGLHRALGIAQDKKIPEKKLEKALNSDNPHVRHMAQAAENARKANGY